MEEQQQEELVCPAARTTPPHRWLLRSRDACRSTKRNRPPIGLEATLYSGHPPLHCPPMTSPTFQSCPLICSLRPPFKPKNSIELCNSDIELSIISSPYVLLIEILYLNYILFIYQSFGFYLTFGFLQIVSYFFFMIPL